MSARFKFTCEGCSLEATIDFSGKIAAINAPAFACGTLCPRCGGRLSAAGGKYVPDETGLMIKVEEFQGDDLSPHRILN